MRFVDAFEVVEAASSEIAVDCNGVRGEEECSSGCNCSSESRITRFGDSILTKEREIVVKGKMLDHSDTVARCLLFSSRVFKHFTFALKLDQTLLKVLSKPFLVGRKLILSADSFSQNLQPSFPSREQTLL